jgi:hypothetical protein
VNAGIHDGIPEQQYHADKESLSVSGAKKLLPPSCPALFKWERDNGQPPKAAFDFGHAAHAAVLGVGAELAVIEAEDWRSKAAREARDEAYAAGKTPILAADKVRVDGMAEALRANPLAAALLNPDRGKPEQSAYWLDPTHDVVRRCRFDWLPDTDGGRLLLTDYKSTASAEPKAFAKSAATYGYDMQAAWYMDVAHGLGLADDIAFLFVAQEKTAPYLVTVCELDTEAVARGRRRNDRALQVYAECSATDTWPSYTTDVELISLPRWAFFEDAA